MRLTVLLIVHETIIQSVESVNHFLRSSDRNRKSECLLRARVSKMLNDVVIFLIWREGFRTTQTAVTRPGKRSLCTHVGITVTNGERGSRRICKRNTKELVRVSLVDTNEGPIVEFDFWILRLGGNSRRLEATGIVGFESKARVLHGDLYGERVDWRGKR